MSLTDGLVSAGNILGTCPDTDAGQMHVTSLIREFNHSPSILADITCAIRESEGAVSGPLGAVSRVAKRMARDIEIGKCGDESIVPIEDRPSANSLLSISQQIGTIVGPMVGSVCHLISLIIGLSIMHRCSPGKVALAIFTPALVCCFCYAMVMGVTFMIGIANH